jgi:transposase
MKCIRVSIDLAKNVFQIAGFNETREVIFNKKVKRSNLIYELSQIEPTTVVMEACYSSNPWGRRIEKLGHEVALIPPFIVKPFVIGNKNDHNDTIGIGEASFRPNIRFVKVKPVEQQDIQSLEKIKDLMNKSKTATANQMRGLLTEYGEILPVGIPALLKGVPDILENADNELSDVSRNFINRLFDNLKEMLKQIEEVKREIIQLVKGKEDYQRLLTIPGVGPVIAAAIMGSVIDANAFKNGRQFAAWIGLTPSQYASGETNRMGKITKKGNNTLRRLFIHGARAVLNWCDNKEDQLSCWLKGLKKRMHGCKAVVALANKLARIAWSVLAHKQEFDIQLACAK